MTEQLIGIGSVEVIKIMGDALEIVITLDTPIGCPIGGLVVVAESGDCRLLTENDLKRDFTVSLPSNEDEDRISLQFGEAIPRILSRVLGLLAHYDLTKLAYVRHRAPAEIEVSLNTALSPLNQEQIGAKLIKQINLALIR